MADSLIDRGAKNLVFLGRSSENKPDIASFCKLARSKGVNIVTIQGDVFKMVDVERAVARAISMGPLKGVVHAAMVLQDAFFVSMTLEQFNSAVHPKVHSALNLHNATVVANTDLDFFFMTSSTVTYVGHISQSNYASSNAVLDNLARQRVHMGLPAVTISLGPIRGIGTLNRKPEYAESILRSGLIEAKESEFIRHFDLFTHPQHESKHFDILTQGHILTGVEYSKHDLSMMKVTRIEQDCRSALLVTMLESRKAASSNSGATAELLTSDIPDDCNKAIIVLADAVAQRLAKPIFISVEDIDITRPFSHFGLDNMSGSELIHWLNQNFGVGMLFLQLLATLCTPKSLAETIFDTISKAKAAAANGASYAELNNVHHINRVNGTNGVHEANDIHGSNGPNGLSSGSQMERFSEAVMKAIANPNPVMHL